MIQIALLRGINVGGNKMLAMAELRAIAAQLGLSQPKTLLQSGNLVFGSDEPPVKIETMLEAKTGVTVLVRTADEWREIVAGNPFPKEAKSDPGHLVVMALKTPGDAKLLVMSEREVARGKGRHIYLYYPDGQGRSKLTNAVIERTLGTRGTARNWNTVLKLAGITQD